MSAPQMPQRPTEEMPQTCQTQSVGHSRPRLRLALSGGGTGGHVYPALAILEALAQVARKPEAQTVIEVVWLGGKRGIEREIVAQYAQNEDGQNLSLEYCGISCGKLRRYFSWKNFTDLLRVALGIWQSYRLLRRKRPDLLFSKGGFVSVPGLIAARLLGIPCLGHESDLDPGLATRLSLPLVKAMFLPYEESRKYYKAKYQSKLKVSGNPVRREFYADAHPIGQAQKTAQELQLLPSSWFDAAGKLRRPLILVLGGSLGSWEINSYLRCWLKEPIQNRNWLNNYYILHQCGQRDYVELQHLERLLEFENFYRVRSFIPKGLAAIYQICRDSGGLVVSRAGAGSLWEILASGNRSVLVPLQTGSRGDQLRNARLFSQKAWAHCFVANPPPPAKPAGEPRDGNIQRNSQKLLEQILLILHDESFASMDSSIGSSVEISQCPEQVSADAHPGIGAAEHIANEIWRRLQAK